MSSPDHETHHTAKLAALRRRLDHLLKPQDPLPPGSQSETPSQHPTAPEPALLELRRNLRKHTKADRTTPPENAPTAAPPCIHYARHLPRQAPSPAQDTSPAQHVPLEQAVAGNETTDSNGRPFYLTTTRLTDIAEGHLDERYRSWLQKPGARLREQLEPVLGPPPWDAEQAIFMDVESTGLGSSPVFLIGVMLWCNGGFEVRQFLARNYAEEAAIITGFADLCQSCQVLVTFNGKSFDVPFLRTRAAATGVRFATPTNHLDLLHVSRRIWRDALPDCKLQTLEKHICGRIRTDDIPGAEIPDAYHAYVRTANAVAVATIISHNMFDLVTLADLLARLETGPNGACHDGCRPLSG